MRIAAPNLKATVSGSFHRHMEAITVAVQELTSRSILVLSPSDPRVVSAQGEFLFVASDRVRSVRLVQDRHLDSIRASNFLWLVCPDGYVGQSASMELGFAAAVGVPIFATHAPNDLTLRQYVIVVPKLSDAIHRVKANARPRLREGILIDPHASVEEAHDILGRVERALSRQRGTDQSLVVHRELFDLQKKLRMPSQMQ